MFYLWRNKNWWSFSCLWCKFPCDVEGWCEGKNLPILLQNKVVHCMLSLIISVIIGPHTFYVPIDSVLFYINLLFQIKINFTTQ